MRQHRAPLQGESCSPPNFSGFKLFKIDISYKLYDIDIYRSPKWKKIRFVVKKGASCIIMSFRETGRCLTVEWTREQLGEGTNQEGSLQMSAPGESPTPPARPPAPAGRRRRPQPRQLQPPAAAKASSGHLGLALGLWAESRSVLPWGFSPATPSLFLSFLLALRAQLGVSGLGRPWNWGSSNTRAGHDLRSTWESRPHPRPRHLGDTGRTRLASLGL